MKSFESACFSSEDVPPHACALQRIILYPNYINSLKTMAKGRRIPKDKGKLLPLCLRAPALPDAASCWLQPVNTLTP